MPPDVSFIGGGLHAALAVWHFAQRKQQVLGVKQGHTAFNPAIHFR
jgi:hypothetical protein